MGQDHCLTENRMATLTLFTYCWYLLHSALRLAAHSPRAQGWCLGTRKQPLVITPGLKNAVNTTTLEQ